MRELFIIIIYYEEFLYFFPSTLIVIITELTENFTKVTKYLTKFKETLINYVWEKPHIKKQ